MFDLYNPPSLLEPTWYPPFFPTSNWEMLATYSLREHAGRLCVLIRWDGLKSYRKFQLLGSLRKTTGVKYPWSYREIPCLPVRYHVYPWNPREVEPPKIHAFCSVVLSTSTLWQLSCRALWPCTSIEWQTFVQKRCYDAFFAIFTMIHMRHGQCPYNWTSIWAICAESRSILKGVWPGSWIRSCEQL